MEDEEPFETRFPHLVAQLEKQFKEATYLQGLIEKQLAHISHGH